MTLAADNVTRNVMLRRRLGRQINVRHDRDVGMQQIFTRLFCEDAADKRSSCSICRACDSENTSLSSVLQGRHVRDSVNGRPCRRTDQLHPAVVADGVAQHDPRKEPLQLMWNTNARVLRANFEIHANFVLGSHLVRSKRDDT